MTFSIRDLLLVTVIVALCAAWWVDRSRLATELRREKEMMGIEDTGSDLDLSNPQAPAPNSPKE